MRSPGSQSTIGQGKEFVHGTEASRALPCDTCHQIRELQHWAWRSIADTSALHGFSARFRKWWRHCIGWFEYWRNESDCFAIIHFSGWSALNNLSFPTKQFVFWVNHLSESTIPICLHRVRGNFVIVLLPPISKKATNWTTILKKREAGNSFPLFFRLGFVKSTLWKNCGKFFWRWIAKRLCRLHP